MKINGMSSAERTGRRKEFEEIVKAYLESQDTVKNLQVGKPLKSNSSLSIRPDFMIKAIDVDIEIIIEIKWFSSDVTPMQPIINAALWLSQADNYGRMLIVSSQANDVQRKQLRRLGVILVDRDDLASWTVANPDYLLRLKQIAFIDMVPEFRSPHYESLSEAVKSADELVSSLLDYQYVHEVAEEYAATKKKKREEADDIKKEIKRFKFNHNKGKWRQYEKLCEKVIRFLFAENLDSIKPQAPLGENEIYRTDFIAAIKPSNSSFWHFVREDLKSLFIVFEFKHYREEIGQNEIFLTEKYLYANAYRKVAIIMTHHGSSQNADRVRRGVMRDSGCLMLVLNDDDLETMIDMKLNNNDPSDHLYEMTFEFLQDITR